MITKIQETIYEAAISDEPQRRRGAPWNDARRPAGRRRLATSGADENEA